MSWICNVQPISKEKSLFQPAFERNKNLYNPITSNLWNACSFSIWHGLGPSFNPRTASGSDTRDCNSIYCRWEQTFPPTILLAEANPPGSSSIQLHGHWQSTQQGHGDFTAHSNLLSKTSALSETAPCKARSCALLIQYKNTVFSEIVTEAIVISE